MIQRKVDQPFWRKSTIEQLEGRRLLTSIVNLQPMPGFGQVPENVSIVVSYSEAINPDSLTARTLVVRSQQTTLPSDSIATLVSDRRVTWSQQANFHAGEVVRVSATKNIQNLFGQSLDTPLVWEFRTRVRGGSGIFDEPSQVLPDRETFSLDLGDLNGDGALDMLVPTIARSNLGTRAWLNDGDGYFEDQTQLGQEHSSAVALGDLDGDGDLDAFVGHIGPDTIWLNNGDGHFDDTNQRLAGSFDTRGIALGDVDGDGDLDAVTGGSGNKLWLNNGQGIFEDSDQVLGVSPTMTLQMGDLDGDGDLDIFLGKTYSTDPNEVWLNDGRGIFRHSGQSLRNSGARWLELGDVDGDGDLDAVIANKEIRDRLIKFGSITGRVPLLMVVSESVTCQVTAWHSGTSMVTVISTRYLAIRGSGTTMEKDCFSNRNRTSVGTPAESLLHSAIWIMTGIWTVSSVAAERPHKAP